MKSQMPMNTSFLSQTKAFARQLLGKSYEKRVKRFNEQRSERILNILKNSSKPRSIADEKIFLSLQSASAPLLSYDYDDYSCWKRGIDRATEIIEKCNIKTPGIDILEVCCGDGMVSAALSAYGHNVALLDLNDWRDRRATNLNFQEHDVGSSLPFKSESFNTVFSYNAFEHIPDPCLTLNEIIRVLRPGGLVYIDFYPLYASSWGLHAWRTLKMPYAQFLFSDDYIQRKIQNLGIFDLGKESADIQPLNGWRIQKFRQLWENSGCEVINYQEKCDFSNIGMIERFPDAFTGRQLTLDDLTVSGIQVILRKPVAS